jgi:predicted enzyme related to lactoylglutathione lyase
MDVYNTPGAFSWSELMTHDVEGARSFYSKLFGWGTKDMQMPNGTYTTFQVGEASVGGMMKIPAESAGMAPVWGVYVTVKDVDATIKQVEELGGSVLMAPWDIPSVGRMAMIKDPQGATLAVITYAMPSG